jgi:hypothetical protein
VHSDKKTEATKAEKKKNCSYSEYPTRFRVFYNKKDIFGQIRGLES